MKKTLICLFSLLAMTGCGENKAAKSYDNLKGFDIDLAKAACKKLGLSPVFQEIVWEQKETELNAKKIDLIWNGLTITEERKAAMSLSVPYMKNSQVIVVKNSFSDDEINENDRYTVAFEDGSAGQDAYKDYSMFKNCTSASVSSQINALTEVLSGTSDLAIIDSVMAGYYLSDTTSYGSKLKILSQYKFSDEYYGIAGRKEDFYLMAKINDALSSLYKEETSKTIASAYGLDNSFIAPSEYTKPEDITSRGSYDSIESRGTLIIGYTIFAPIAFEA